VRGRKYKEYLDQFSIYEFELACVILCTQVLCGNLYGKVLENHRCRARNDRMTANKEQKRMRIGGRSPITGTISAFWRNWGKPRNNASISHIPAAIRQWQRPNVRNGANLIAFFKFWTHFAESEIRCHIHIRANLLYKNCCAYIRPAPRRRGINLRWTIMYWH